jgi:Uma2 family endonuclease
LAHSVEIYRRQRIQLELFATLTKGDVLESRLLPGFSVQTEAVFADFS